MMQQLLCHCCIIALWGLIAGTVLIGVMNMPTGTEDFSEVYNFLSSSLNDAAVTLSLWHHCIVELIAGTILFCVRNMPTDT